MVRHMHDAIYTRTSWLFSAVLYSHLTTKMSPYMDKKK